MFIKTGRHCWPVSNNQIRHRRKSRVCSFPSSIPPVPENNQIHNSINFRFRMMKIKHPCLSHTQRIVTLSLKFHRFNTSKVPHYKFLEQYKSMLQSNLFTKILDHFLVKQRLIHDYYHRPNGPTLNHHSGLSQVLCQHSFLSLF